MGTSPLKRTDQCAAKNPKKMKHKINSLQLAACSEWQIIKFDFFFLPDSERKCIVEMMGRDVESVTFFSN